MLLGQIIQKMVMKRAMIISTMEKSRVRSQLHTISKALINRLYAGNDMRRKNDAIEKHYHNYQKQKYTLLLTTNFPKKS